ncbi:hypothetical protein [Pantoea sp. 1B4]|uniref:hypothetical protein n=1 Tax=Pantoea sp. 1B4 TaxID=2804760 RepID=UPI001AA9DD75|nr:hypothetical protein [Pantoea sp. 1B4]MBN1090603.1 hypothetical protein [Pantoea sp. 1B4]
MRNKNREPGLIRVMTLLDNVGLGERQKTISDLLHSARFAIQEGDYFTAQQHITETLGQLRKARHSLQVSGADELEISLLNNAIARLLAVQKEGGADWRAYFFVYLRESRYPLLFLFFVAILAILFVRITG